MPRGSGGQPATMRPPGLPPASGTEVRPVACANRRNARSDVTIAFADQVLRSREWSTMNTVTCPASSPPTTSRPLAGGRPGTPSPDCNSSAPTPATGHAPGPATCGTPPAAQPCPHPQARTAPTSVSMIISPSAGTTDTNQTGKSPANAQDYADNRNPPMRPEQATSKPGRHNPVLGIRSAPS